MSPLPSGARMISDEYSNVWEAYSSLGAATSEAGLLRARDGRAVKLVRAIRAGSEGTTYSHRRRAVAQSTDTDAGEHVALRAPGPLGLPRAVAALAWIHDVVARS